MVWKYNLHETDNPWKTGWAQKSYGVAGDDYNFILVLKGLDWSDWGETRWPMSDVWVEALGNEGFFRVKDEMADTKLCYLLLLPNFTNSCFTYFWLVRFNNRKVLWSFGELIRSVGQLSRSDKQLLLSFLLLWLLFHQWGPARLGPRSSKSSIRAALLWYSLQGSSSTNCFTPAKAVPRLPQLAVHRG